MNDRAPSPPEQPMLPEHDASSTPELLLVHPAVDAEAVRAYLSAFWPDGDISTAPPGYRDISHAFFGMRAFCRETSEAQFHTPDPAIARRAAVWVDELARDWKFSEVFAVQELDLWDFLRDDLIAWLHARLTERRHIEQLLAAGQPVVMAVGLDWDQRALLRRLVEGRPAALRAEIAFYGPPPQPERETATGRRVRKLFFLLQDGWHGVQLLVENILNRRPRVLVMSSERCWKKSRHAEVRAERTDVLMQRVWREGRRRNVRLYYRSDSYHPDVGAMTGGRLAPAYLRHFLFLLAQTSRGFLEVRRIQRQWRDLALRPDFRAALVCDGLSLEELVLVWLELAVSEQLPLQARALRREMHFLRGVRPSVVILAHERRADRAMLAAARRLGIPTVGVQSSPLPECDRVHLAGEPRPSSALTWPTRLCVFSAETKRLLVEHGGLDPATVVVTGDPRLGAEQRPESRSGETRNRVRAAWGVEAGQRVIAVGCRSEECSELLAWLGSALRGREDCFVVLHPEPAHFSEEQRYRRLAARHGLHWFHFDPSRIHADWPAAVDLLVTTQWPELAEGLRLGTQVMLASWGDRARFCGPDPGELVARATTREEFEVMLHASLAQPRVPDAQRLQAFLETVYGAPQDAPARVMDVAERLLAGS